MQSTTLYVAKRLAAAGSSYTQQVVIQSAVTPRVQDRWNSWWYIIPIGVGLLGFLQAWWGGIVALFILVVAMTVFSRTIIPRRLEHYLQLIVVELQNRLADYVRDDDPLRADAAHDILLEVESLLDKARVDGANVPDMIEVRQMAAG